MTVTVKENLLEHSMERQLNSLTDLSVVGKLIG